MAQLQPEKSGFWQALGMAWELGYLIAIPIVVLGLGGRLIDRHFHTSPWFFLLGVVLSIVLTSFSLVWKFKKMLRSIEKESPSPKVPPPPNGR